MTSIFGKPQAPTIIQQAPAPIPAPTPVAPLPTVDSEIVKQQRSLNMANQLTRGGRRSTILTSPESRGMSGSDSYGSSKFGS